MRVLYKTPGEAPRSIVIANDLHLMQQLVGGLIEPIKIADNVVLICNEEGKLLDLEPNFFIGALGDVIYGPAIVVGTKGDEFCSLADTDADLIGKILRGGFEV